MRTILGVLVLCFGVGVLGWWGSKNNAVRMEQDVTTGASAVVADRVHPLSTSVGGRDITVSGLVDSEADRDTVVAALNDVTGRRVVHDDLTVLTTASPYEFVSTVSEDGQSYSGNVPTEAQRQAFADRIGSAAAGMTLSAGMPDAAWPGVVGQGLDGLAGLKSGTLTIQDRAVHIEGLAALPSDKNAVLASLAGLPDGYSLTDDIMIEDDGTPMRLTVRKDSNGATSVGKMPVDTDIAALETTFGQGLGADDVSISQVAGPTADWGDFVNTGVSSLALLDTGTLSITDTDLNLTGVATRVGKMTAENQLAELDTQYGVRSDISLLDDGTPLRLSMVKDADATTAGGKLPFGMAAADLAGAFGANVATDDVTIANIDADQPDWSGAALSGVQGLSSLTTGTLDITDQSFVLRGVANRSGKAAAEAAVAGVTAQGFDLTTDIEIADDGRPFAL
ncbi:MAG: hypothetical protein AAF386_07810, partial [Pseudomonadota bacterium]